MNQNCITTDEVQRETCVNGAEQPAEWGWGAALKSWRLTCVSRVDCGFSRRGGKPGRHSTSQSRQDVGEEGSRQKIKMENTPGAILHLVPAHPLRKIPPDLTSSPALYTSQGNRDY